jgi:hypothetical protein
MHPPKTRSAPAVHVFFFFFFFFLMSSVQGLDAICIASKSTHDPRSRHTSSLGKALGPSNKCLSEVK